MDMRILPETAREILMFEKIKHLGGVPLKL